jgi:hypothetical protein
MKVRLCISMLARHKGRSSFTGFATMAPKQLSLVTQESQGESLPLLHRFSLAATATYLDRQLKSVFRDSGRPEAPQEPIR